MIIIMHGMLCDSTINQYEYGLKLYIDTVLMALADIHDPEKRYTTDNPLK